MKKIVKLAVALLLILVSTVTVCRYIYKTEYIDIINAECVKYNIDPKEVLSIIKAESNFKKDAVSSKEAYGLMQITLKTANWCAEMLDMNVVAEQDLYNPEINIKLGVYYYNYLLSRYNNRDTAIAAYNAGMGNVDKWLDDFKYSDDGVIIKTTPFNETNKYLIKINNNIKLYTLLYKEL